MRKVALQARSRVTVEAIVEAGTQVLGRAGWVNFNTNSVAQIAGVSIGTPYQYFPNKLALLEAIRQRHFEQVLSVLRATISGTQALPARLEALVAGVIAVHGVSPALHRALLEDSPRTRQTRASDEAFQEAYFSAYRELVARASERRRRGSVELAARVVAAAVPKWRENASGVDHGEKEEATEAGYAFGQARQ